MNACRGRSKEFGLYADETFVPIRRQNAKFLQRQEKKGPNKEVLVRLLMYSSF